MLNHKIWLELKRVYYSDIEAIKHRVKYTDSEMKFISMKSKLPASNRMGYVFDWMRQGKTVHSRT